MNQDFVLGTISSLMGWGDDKSREEFAWLRLMSRMKYDDYQEFLAGMRFLESLADWLQQFERHERAAAYEFIRRRLVFFSVGEMRHLVDLFYPDTVQPRLMHRAAEIAEIPYYAVWADAGASEQYRTLLRKSIFIELSDGARIDIFRRLNEGRVSNEQVVTAPRINKAKWDDMLKELRQDLADPDAKFAFVFLVDDFTASGTSLLRPQDGNWKGKLQRCWEDMQPVLQTHFEPSWNLIVHHYIATAQAINTVNERVQLRKADPAPWFDHIELTHGCLLPDDFRVTPGDDIEFASLVQKYYDDAVASSHTLVGGTKDARWGFGGCGLPLVLEHNTPNNSIALLWAETAGDNAHPMRPLFRRRQRHL